MEPITRAEIDAVLQSPSTILAAGPWLGLAWLDGACRSLRIAWEIECDTDGLYQIFLGDYGLPSDVKLKTMNQVVFTGLRLLRHQLGEAA